MSDLNPYASPATAELTTTAPPRTSAGVLGEAAGLFQRNFLLICALALGIFLPLELLGAYLATFVFDPEDIGSSLRFSSLTELAAGTFVAAAVIELGAISSAGKQPAAGQVLARAARAWLRLILTRILCNLAIIAGLVLLVLPGIYLVGRLCLADAATVREGLSGRRAMQRSFELTKGRFPMIFALNAAVFTILLVAIAIVTVPSIPFPLLNHWVLQAIASTLVGLPIAYGTLCFFCAYRQLVEELDNP